MIIELQNGLFAASIPGDPISYHETLASAEITYQIKRSFAGFLNLGITGEQLMRWERYRDADIEFASWYRPGVKERSDD